MGFNPWVSEQLMKQHVADLQRSAARLRTSGRAHRAAHASKPGPVTRRTARLLVAMGWRLAGPDAVPVRLEGRLIPGGHA